MNINADYLKEMPKIIDIFLPLSHEKYKLFAKFSNTEGDEQKMMTINLITQIKSTKQTYLHNRLL